MEHLLLKAAVTAATDQGTFEAVISTASIDREKDIVDPAGMVRALLKWVPTGKNIPLAWNHSSAAADQIGYIDPASAKAVGSEVVAQGWIDQSSAVGADAWRLVKAGTLGFSFGYLTLDSSPRKGGGLLLKELDVFEVTATPTPMNNDTRILGWKAAAAVEEQEQDTLETVIELIGDFLSTEDDQQDIASARDILSRLQALLAAENAETPDAGKALLSESEAQVALAALARIPQSKLSQAVKDELTLKAQRILDAQKSVDMTGKESSARSVDPLRAKADALALELASDGESLKQPPQPAKKAPPPDLVPLKELKRRMREEMLTALSGMDIESE